MAITQAMCTSFKQELLEGKHDFRTSGHTFNIALFTSSATLGASTTDYSTTNEVSGTGYTAGGQALTTAGGSSTTDAVIVLAFGGDKTSTAGDFTIQFPTADASNAIIRIA